MPKGLYVAKYIPQGVLNATAYFQAMLQHASEGLNFMVSVDGFAIWIFRLSGANDGDATLGWLERVSLCGRD